MSKIKVGQEFVCIKNVKMKLSGILAYTKGYIYKSEIEFCITSNQNEIYNCWTEYNKETKKYFLKIKNK